VIHEGAAYCASSRAISCGSITWTTPSSVRRKSRKLPTLGFECRTPDPLMMCLQVRPTPLSAAAQRLLRLQALRPPAFHDVRAGEVDGSPSQSSWCVACAPSAAGAHGDVTLASPGALIAVKTNDWMPVMVATGVLGWLLLEVIGALYRRRLDERTVWHRRCTQTPPTTRSERQRFGARFRVRFRISNCCLRSTDSATTERAPPGPASRGDGLDQVKNEDGQVAHWTILPRRHSLKMFVI
jgi:hypothetical protein